jgi:hypothetical protein
MQKSPRLTCLYDTNHFFQGVSPRDRVPNLIFTAAKWTFCDGFRGCRGGSFSSRGAPFLDRVSGRIFLCTVPRLSEKAVNRTSIAT